MKCGAKTKRLNCGCCDDVVLTCDKPEGHPADHWCVIEEGGETYRIKWKRVNK